MVAANLAKAAQRRAVGQKSMCGQRVDSSAARLFHPKSAAFMQCVNDGRQVCEKAVAFLLGNCSAIARFLG
jgi:hypothetical protein